MWHAVSLHFVLLSHFGFAWKSISSIINECFASHCVDRGLGTHSVLNLMSLLGWQPQQLWNYCYTVCPTVTVDVPTCTVLTATYSQLNPGFKEVKNINPWMGPCVPIKLIFCGIILMSVCFFSCSKHVFQLFCYVGSVLILKAVEIL